MDYISGKCLCGEITVSVTKEAFNVGENTFLCHCKNCRQAGGCLASILVKVPESTVIITGEPKEYRDNNTDSGTSLHRFFCGNCGSPLYSTTRNAPGCQFIKLGLFDEIPKPSMEYYRKNRPSWNKSIDDAKQVDAMPTKL